MLPPNSIVYLPNKPQWMFTSCNECDTCIQRDARMLCSWSLSLTFSPPLFSVISANAVEIDHIRENIIIYGVIILVMKFVMAIFSK